MTEVNWPQHLNPQQNSEKGPSYTTKSDTLYVLLEYMVARHNKNFGVHFTVRKIQKQQKLCDKADYCVV